MTDPNEDRFEDARQLWAGRFQAVLNTQSLADPGYPFASVVPYCLDRAGHALLLLSHLAQHTKNLLADPRCGLSVAAATDGDIQQSLRVSCPADCAAADPTDGTSHRRWFRYFPGSRMYFEQLNFRLYRLTPRRFHFNGGFATARWLGAERILRGSPWDEAGELAMIRALQDRAELPLGAAAGFPDGTALRVAGVDPWGLDLAQGDRLRRLPLPGPLRTLEAITTLIQAQAPG